MEERIADTWQQLLAIEKVGATDNFFVMGGDSLLATQLKSPLHDIFRVEVPLLSRRTPLRDPFEAATMADMALLVEEAVIQRIEELGVNKLKSCW